MLKHELLESEMMKDKTIPYESAHDEINKVYNYSKALDKWKKRE